MNNPSRAAELLSQALQATQYIQENVVKVNALSAIASASADLDNPSQTVELLSQILQVTQNIQEDEAKLAALSTIADAAAGLNDSSRLLSYSPRSYRLLKTSEKTALN